PRFVERQSRLEHRQDLKALLENAMQCNSAEYWRDKLNEAGVPAGCVATVSEALAQEQIASRGMIATFNDTIGVDRDIQIARPGIKLNGAPVSTDLAPPALGQHTTNIMQELGYSDQDIENYKNKGVI
ncbi:MAG: CoA transferase, partial [Alphaproteobacteria bacterium]|nr:CoA transferase [Alphaproteobacteria bacterium]